MGIPDPRIVNKESVKHLKCSICTELVDDVRTLRDCRHIFCKDCIDEWYKRQASSPLLTARVGCPDCRKLFAYRDIIKVHTN